MTDFAQKARAQFADARAELVRVEIPELGSHVYVYPAVNLRERDAIQAVTDHRGVETPGFSLAVLVNLARHEDGRLIYPPKTRAPLETEIAPHVVDQAAAAILGAVRFGYSEDEVKKSSET